MKNLFNRAKFVSAGEKGSLPIELIAWFSTLMVITSAIVYAVIQIVMWYAANH